MTQEDKAKAYDKALERARALYSQGAPDSLTLESMFPELAESEDEKIKKELIEEVKDQIDSIPAPDCRDKEDEKILKQLKKWLAWLEKQGEQKSADKAEPKFKVGDWIIRSAEGFKHNTYLIKEVKDYYVCEDLKGRRVTFKFIDVHKNFKLWDISDAKDGDVLYAKGSYFKEYLFMFSSFTEDNVISTHFGYDVFHGTFDTKLTRFGRKEDFAFVTPATKEQRDLLFSKMHEAEYIFDFEKKELKKCVIDEGKAEMDYCFTKMMNGEKVSPAWDEEDEHRIKDTIYFLDTAKKHYASAVELDACINWLKSLKQKIGE